MQVRYALPVLLFCTAADADTLLWNAVEDFDPIDAGAVPYYIDEPRQVLAINAANPAYRDVLARAERVFDGTPGVYDLELVTLGEEDGEGRYLVWVDGLLVMDVSNEAVEPVDDLEPQTHVTEAVTIALGSVIAVESDAVTNGLIPEGDGTAFARGRWRSLAFEPVATPVAPEAADLSLDSETRALVLDAGDTGSWTLGIANAGAAVATGVRLELQLPAGPSIVPPAECARQDQAVVCALPELAPGDSLERSVTFQLPSGFEGTVLATVSADQTDPNTGNDGLVLSLSGNADEAPSGGADIETEPPATEEDNGGTDDRDGGGGALGAVLALLLGASTLRRRRSARCRG